MQTQLAPQYASPPRRPGSRSHPAQVRALRLLHRHLPHLPAAGRRGWTGPRGRIYLIKQVLEGAEPTRATQMHLDRCLTCRNCESTCPSGVQYGHLVDIGRKIVDESQCLALQARKALRWALKEGCLAAVRPRHEGRAVVRGLLPEALKAKVPAPMPVPGPRANTRARSSCWWLRAPAMMPNINTATARVLDAVGVQSIIGPKAGCCGAVKFHLNDQEGGLAEMRANIDAWWPWWSRAGRKPLS